MPQRDNTKMKKSLARFKKITKKVFWWGVLFALVFSVTFYSYPTLIGAAKESKEKTCVLRLWHVDSFEGGVGSRANFLKNAAVEYVRRENNVLVVVSSYTLEGLHAEIERGNVPELISFGVGAALSDRLFLRFDRSFLRDIFRSAELQTPSFSAESRVLPWCCGRYALYAKSGDFLDLSVVPTSRTVVSHGGNNLPEAAAAYAFPSVEGISVSPSVTAYLSFLNGEKDYLLGTQRDAYRFASRGVDVDARYLQGYGDLYQCIGVTKATDKQSSLYCIGFLRYLLSAEVQTRLSAVGMFSALYRVYTRKQTEENAIMRSIEDEVFKRGAERRRADVFFSLDVLSQMRLSAKNGNLSELQSYLIVK